MKKILLFLALAIASLPAFAQAPSLLHLLPKPCRTLDTRSVGGAIAANSTLSFAVNPAAAPSQGGTSGCGVPASAVAVQVLVKGQSVTVDGGYFKIFNGSESSSGIFSSLNLQDPGQFVAASLDIPVDTAKVVSIYSLHEAHAVVDIAGWYEKYLPEVTVVKPGEVSNYLELLPNSIEFYVAGERVVCREPYISPSACANASGCRVVRGHRMELYGESLIYAQSVGPCPAPPSEGSKAAEICSTSTSYYGALDAITVDVPGTYWTVSLDPFIPWGEPGSVFVELECLPAFDDMDCMDVADQHACYRIEQARCAGYEEPVIRSWAPVKASFCLPPQ